MAKCVFLFSVVLVFFTGCDPKNAGPVGNYFIFENYWKLDAYLINNRSQPLDSAGDFSYLSFPDMGDNYTTKFEYWDKALKPTNSFTIESVSWDVNKRRDVGTYIKRTESGKFFKAVVFVDKPKGVPIKMELSNLMDGNYKQENDTIKYIYVPTEKFDTSGE